ncbi:MAG: hypothetical protein KF684_03985 [Phycisphaeraceae bacterium]|nr:hypothetical protein [Phycisphaeraceae bacterium]
MPLAHLLALGITLAHSSGVGAPDQRTPLRDDVIAASRAAQATARAVAVLPMYADRDCFTPEQLAAVEALNAIPDEQIETLLASDDPWVVGVGIYLADVRLRPDILLKHPALLDDRRPTVPDGTCPGGWQNDGVGSGKFSAHRMSLHRRSSEAIHTWFRMLPNTTADFHAFFPENADAWTYLEPWQALLSRARQSADPQRLADAKRRVLDAPPALRWAILAREAAFPPDENPVFTPDDLRDAMRALDNTTKDAILRGEAPLPDDIRWQRETDEISRFSRAMHEAAIALLR